MKRYYLIIGLFVVAFLLMVGLESSAPRELDWTESYHHADKRPFGAYAIENLLPAYLGKSEFYNQSSLYELYQNWDVYGNGFLVVVNAEFRPDEESADALLKLVNDGNTALISAGDFSYEIESKLHFTSSYEPGSFLEADSTRILVYAGTEQRFETELRITDSYITLSEDQIKEIADDSLMGAGSLDTLGYYFDPLTQEKKLNFIRLKYGQGVFLIHSSPRVFTNYGLMDTPGALAARMALEPLAAAMQANVTPQRLCIDRYYKTSRTENRTPLRAILAQRELKWAMYLGLASLVAFVLFGAKRRQRPIPILPPLTNETLDFISTLAMLYYNKKNHRTIAQLQIRHFTYFIIEKFGLQPIETHAQAIANRSGVPLKQVSSLLGIMAYTQRQTLVSHEELMNLNEKIESFKQNSIVK